ncbi:MAG: uracil-DNA glycosylase [Verrucomicrobiae bacterium]|nr:uracil-DNA glycosylase [Verrucomicrobiae bacterium]NNJ87113.1 uracil-DNA glycosylase [Akkermansiaceae bacterium]
MPTQADPLIRYLRELESQGQSHISVDDEARMILRKFFLRARAGGAQTPSGPQKSSPQPAAAAIPAGNPQSAPAPVVEKLSPSLTVEGSTASEKIDSLRRQAIKWAPAQALSGLRNTMVFSVGNPEADVMLVGEAPGYDEERLGEPFVGKAGQKLDGILQAMGVKRTSVYLSNIVKFRPAMPNQTTNNRKPAAEEINACLPFIQEEVKIVAPRVIIALGGTAAQAMLDCQQSVASMRGQFHQYQGVPLRVTYHPSYILHNEATSEKRKLWEDMLAVMDFLKMPVSEKQRGYFLTQ